MKVTFIGLGAMGLPMAVNLARAGHQMTVFNRSPKPLDAFADRPPRVAGDPRAAVAGADAVLTMLADDAALEAVVQGGLLEGLGAAAAPCRHGHGQHRHGAPDGRLHAERGRAYLAAPVFGRPDAAAAAKLWILLAGEAGQRAGAPAAGGDGRRHFGIRRRTLARQPGEAGQQLRPRRDAGGAGEAFALMRKAEIPPQDFLDAVNSLFQSPVTPTTAGMIAGGHARAGSVQGEPRAGKIYAWCWPPPTPWQHRCRWPAWPTTACSPRLPRAGAMPTGACWPAWRRSAPACPERV